MATRTQDAPYFLITIDTEGDNLWDAPREVTTRNADYLERFQLLCEEFGLRPTWLTNNEMIGSSVFRSFAADVISRGVAEVGMHLHAWDSPPIVPLTPDDMAVHPYLIEYEPDVMREKIHALTVTLEDALGTKVVSHRAGRWGFDERYASMLVEEGYEVDCSVTPLVSWLSTLGDPDGAGGPDYRAFPRNPYWVDLTDISRPGDSPLLEVPVTIAPTVRLPRRLSRFLPRRLRRPQWLRPTGENGPSLLRTLTRVRMEGRPCAEFMLHSSELMPGGSPTFPTEASIEKLYRDLQTLFGTARTDFRPATLAEFRCHFAGTPRPSNAHARDPH